MTAEDTQLLLDTIIGLFSFLMLMIVPFIAWIKLGGHPEGTYRIFRIKYFSACFIDSEQCPRRFPLRLSRLKTGAPKLPSYFEYKGFANGVGRYYTDPNNMTRHTGRPSWYYFPDNPFPIPILKMARDALMSADNLEKAFADETVLDFQKVGKERKKQSGTSRLQLVLMAVAVIGVLALLAEFVRPHP